MEHVKQFPSQDVRRKLARMCLAGNGNSTEAVVHNAILECAGGTNSGIQSEADRNLSLFPPKLRSYRFIYVHELESIL
jgi:hypothetical protein